MPGATLTLHETFMSSVDFETAVQQEEAYLRKVHPTSDDIPSCMKLFDNFLQCNGASLDLSDLAGSSRFHSGCGPDEVSIQVWAYGAMFAEARGLQVLHEQQIYGAGREI